ncbi:Sec-independent protein translocase protein TatA [Caballeronia udeis]|uniref:Sec-independent protein translocase protein TatA n=1 Tax=Caballeronia udeis TaxID=1232866 RepID=A0ABW8MNG7_9BURK
MNDERPSVSPTFNPEADRRAHDIARLPEDLRDRAKDIEREYKEKRSHLKNLQERQREQDVEKERKKIRRDRPSKTYEKEKWRISSPRRRDTQDIDREAECAVETRNAEALVAIDIQRDADIDEVLALARDRDPNAAQDENAIEASREARKSDRGPSLYRGGNRDSGNRGRDR